MINIPSQSRSDRRLFGQHSIAVHSDQGGDEHREGQAEANFAAYH
jgi:hypothetical protein